MADDGAALEMLLVTEAPSEMVRCGLAPLEVQKEPAQAGKHAWTAGQR